MGNREGWFVQFYRCLTLLLLGCAASAQLLPARYILAGTLGSERVQLELTLSGNRALGRFISAPTRRSTQRSLQRHLSGEVAENGEVRLRGAGLSLRGRLPEAFETEPRFSGTLAGRPFSLAIIAPYTVRRLMQGPFLEVGSETPFFLGPPWRQVNARLERFTRAPAARFTRDAQGLAARGELDYPYTYESRLSPTRLTPTLLSLLETQYIYTGGAHPNTGYRSLTFHNEGPRVTPVGLKGLFRGGAPYRRVLLAEVTRKLRARRAAWLEDGSVTLSERDLSVFTLSARGLEFVFAPYAVGPYAQGAFFITVPYDALTKLLKPAFLP